MTEEIGHGLGKVVLDGHGRLKSITIDREAFHSVNETALATKVVEAVNRAESAAQRQREGDLW